jgi:amidase
MDPADYRASDGLGLAELVRSGKVTPHEALDAALAAVEAINPSVNAIVNLFESRARQAIDEGLPSGPFRGVPFVMKDLWTRVAGVATSNGSRLFADDVASEDSEIVRRFRSAGLVCFAKSNTPELGLSPSTEPALFGPVRNPWDMGRSAGGSSGGAAAAVAAGMLPVAHATDGGGSIRIPASCCGVFGLKPTRGRVPQGPERGEGWNGMSAQHVVSRSVRDSAAMLDVVSGPMVGDPYWAPPGAVSYRAEAEIDPGTLRVGLCVEAPSGTVVDPACRAVAESTARRCEALGHRVSHVSWPFSGDDHVRAQGTIVATHIAATIEARLTALDRPLAPGDIEPLTNSLRERGLAATGVEYVGAIQAMHRLGRAMGTLFEGVDVLLTPMVARVPPPLGTLDPSDPARFGREVGYLSAFGGVANLSGQPAMSVPLDVVEGLPVGSQFIARFGDETTLLRLAGQLERAYGWPGMSPRSSWST